MKQADLERVDINLTDFLAYLRGQGFIIGVDHHLRLQALLRQLGPGPLDLKYLLCPLFAVSEKQQRLFYNAYETFFTPLEDNAEEQAPETSGQAEVEGRGNDSRHLRLKKQKRQYIVLGILLVILFLVTGYRLRDISEPEVKDTEFKDIVSRNGDPEPVMDAGLDKPKATPEVKPSFIEVQEWALHMEELNRPEYEPDFYERNYTLIREGGLVFLLVIFLLLERYRNRRRSLVLSRERGKKPPYVWPIEVVTPEKGPAKSDGFYETAGVFGVDPSTGVPEPSYPIIRQYCRGAAEAGVICKSLLLRHGPACMF